MPILHKRVLVTGGAGFVGGHLVDALVADGHEVLVIDNFFAGRRENVPAGVRLVEMDLGRADERDVFAVFRDFIPDAVVHLAAIHHIPYCLANPGHTFESNVRGTELVIRALEGLPTQRIVAASTADVYSNTDVAHVETESPGPANPYGLSKLLMEEIVACGVRTNPALSGVILRLFNIFGLRETNSHVIPRILELIGNPKEPEIRMGCLGGTRDFVNVADVVNAIIAALDYRDSKFEIFNIGGGSPVSIRAVLDTLLEAAGDRRDVIEGAAQFRTFERRTLTADISKANRLLKWHPKGSVQRNLPELLQEQYSKVATPAK